MNQIQATKRINNYALETGDLSWHDQYKDSAYINIGGLPLTLTEGDVITIFSQYGEVVDINMPRDAQTGKPRGFAWLMYADQRSTVLAVDNLNGAIVLKRTLRVDHVLDYKQLERDQETGKMKEREERSLAAHPDNFRRAAGGSDASDADSDSSHPSIDLDDPMRDYLIEQKRAAKKRRVELGGGESKEDKRRRKEERRRKREEREKRRERKAIEGNGRRSERGHEEREDEREGRDGRTRRTSERGDSRDRASGRASDSAFARRAGTNEPAQDHGHFRGDGVRRRDERDHGRASERDRTSNNGGGRDRSRENQRVDAHHRQDERDERDRRDEWEGRRTGGGSRGSGMSAYADLERVVRGGR